MSARNLLDQIQITNPCSADWNSMIGNDQVRFCNHCNLSVQDLSQMTRKRVLRLAAHSKGRLCIRYQRRPDGSLVTKSVPQLHQISRRASRIAAGAFSATLSISSAVAQPLPTNSTGSHVASILAIEQIGSSVNQVFLGAIISGTITDPMGAVIPGATIRLLSSQGNLVCVVNSNDEGGYRFENLEAGTYSLRIEALGFTASEITSIVLQSDTNQTFNQMLEVAGTVAMVGVMVMIVDPAEPLIKAAKEDDLQTVEALLTDKNVNKRDQRTGTTALEHAVRNGNQEMIQVLLRTGADVNNRTESQETVLMMFGEEGTSDIVWDLINAGAKVNLKDDEGSTALMEAAMLKNLGVLNALLHAGAKVDARNDEGQTALMLAASNGQLANVRALIRAGADMNAHDKDRKTVLDHAMEDDQEKVVKML